MNIFLCAMGARFIRAFNVRVCIFCENRLESTFNQLLLLNLIPRRKCHTTLFNSTMENPV